MSVNIVDMTTDGFLAKYDGNKCLLCGLAIHANHDLIVGLGAKGHYRHADCTKAYREAAIREAYSRTADLAQVIDWIYAGVRHGSIGYDAMNDWITYAQEVAA